MRDFYDEFMSPSSCKSSGGPGREFVLWHAGDCTPSRHRRHLDDVPGWEKLPWLQGKTLCSVMSSIRVSKTGRPTELQFFLNGKLDDSAPLPCSLELAKRIAQETVDWIIAENPHRKAAENREMRDKLLRR